MCSIIIILKSLYLNSELKRDLFMIIKFHHGNEGEFDVRTKKFQSQQKTDKSFF